jgi:hypothetical protein
MMTGPAFRRNTVPSATSPWTDTSLTSGFQLGQPLRSAMRSHSASGEAVISICPPRTTGGFRFAFTTFSKLRSRPTHHWRRAFPRRTASTTRSANRGLSGARLTRNR